MMCERCQTSQTELYLVSPTLHQLTTPPNEFICRQCSLGLNILCEQHNALHEGFDDGTHACLQCVVDDLRQHQDAAPMIYQQLKTSLPPTALDDLVTRARISRESTGDTTPIAILRFIITKHHRTHTPINQIIQTMINTESVQLILT